MAVLTTKAKLLTIHEKINIRSWYSDKESRSERPYLMTYTFLHIWTWNIKPYFKTN